MSSQGRPRGVPNKVSALLKDMILGAPDQAGGEGGGQAYLARQAEENPAAFMALVALPLPVTGESARHQVASDEKPNATGR